LTNVRPKKKATLRDVARLANVAPQTVSNALFNLKEVRPETRRRVEAAISELGYRPNWAARVLRSRRVEAIGLLLEDPNELELHDPLNVEFLNGVSFGAREAGYTVTLDFTAPDETVARALHLVHEQRVGGLVMSLGNLNSRRRSALRSLASEGVPIVLIQNWIAEPGVITVCATDRLGAEQAFAHLLHLGHRRIAYLSARPSWPAPKQRRDSIFNAARAAGIEVVEWSCPAYTVKAARETLASEFGREKQPTALMAVNDIVALGAIQQAQAMGVRVPHDLSVVGFNDFPMSSWVYPAITTVRIPGAAMGRRAVELILQAQKAGGARQSSSFEAELIVRDSTASAPEQSPRTPGAD
jgi:DNA-binding LacI/PurR family transcriptional regulator